MKAPRDYQEPAIRAPFEYFAKGGKGNPIIALPTGTGKSLVLAEIIRRVMSMYPGQRVMVLTHVKELIVQDVKALLDQWPSAPCGIYSSGLNRADHHCPITFAGIQSVKNRTQLFGKHDIILVDEAHLVGENDTSSYLSFFAKMKAINPLLKIIGLTATKYRVGLGQLTNGKIFTDVCFDMTDLKGFNWLLGQGYMKPLIPQPTELAYETDKVKSGNNGEYNLTQMQNEFDQADLNEKAIREIMEKGYNRKHWLIFASGVEHACHLADVLNDRGIPSIAIHSKMGDDARDQAILGFKLGVYKCAVNNGVLTTGFDFPEIDLIAVLRMTKSAALWVQLLGRGTRPVFSKGPDLNTRMGRLEAIYYGGAPDCLVLDFARNTPRLGPINDPVEPKKKGEPGGGGTAPVKECPACGTYIHASVTICPYCKADIPRQLKIEASAGVQAIIKLEEDKPPAAPSQVMPVIESFPVRRVVYQKHEKPLRPTSLKVSYYVGTSGLRRFEEWVLLEHDGRARDKARGWWKSRTGQEAPATVDDALLLVDTLRIPDVIRVRTDTKYPDVLGYEHLIDPPQSNALGAIGLAARAA